MAPVCDKSLVDVTAGAAPAALFPSGGVAVLLHGLARTGWSLARLRRRLERACYPTWAETYPSRRLSLDQLVDHLAERIARGTAGAPVVGVTHSLGGILARQLHDRLPWRGLVMIAPPNQGSRVAARLRHNWLFRWSHGPAGPELASGAGWPLPGAPFAIIAGTRGLALGNPTSWGTRALGLLPADVPSDGTVAVAETLLAGMADFATVDSCHTWIADHPRTAQLVLRFFARGSFAAAGAARAG